MKTISSNPTFSFLQSGGEMGELIRNYPWENTSLGPPGQWPQSLRTTISIILNSRFPMFLFWGSDLICFYNDAYRPSLGNNGKHPTALGQKGEDCWPEIWSFIKPLIDNVLAGGGATWNEDQLLPIYRNGKLEDVYWTFSYSPVSDETGHPAGVFVTCTETTEKVKNFAALKDSKDQLAFAIEATKLATWDLNPITNKFTADARYTKWFGIPAENETNNDLALSVIAGEDRERVIAAYTAALDYNKQSNYDIEYTIRPRNKPERILRAKGQAWFGDDKIAYRFNGTLQDVTAQALDRKKMEESESRIRSLVREAPVASCLFRGREMIIEVANETIIGYWGKGTSVIGKALREVLPELEGQPFLKILDDVFTTGKPFQTRDARAELIVNGIPGTYYFDSTYKPLRNSNGEIYGVMDTAIDVTEKVLARKKIEESERNLRNTILQAPVAICILKGPENIVEIANARMLELLGKNHDEVVGKSLFEGVPNVKGVGLEELLDNVLRTGETYKAHEVPFSLNRNGSLETVFVDYVYEAFKETNDIISGVIVVAMEVTEQVIARKKTEESEAYLQRRIKERTAELQRSNEDLQQFAHVASHDLKEPVRKIRTFSSRMRKEFDQLLPDKAKLFMDKVESAAMRMSAMIDGVLQYSSVNATNELAESVNLSEVFHNIETDLEVLIEQKAATIKYGNLPVIEGASLLLYQLFYNLFLNSLKFSPQDVAPEITITCKITPEPVLNGRTPAHTKDYVHIKVQDNGIGFDQEQALNIFKTFSRLHPKDKYEGTGLGLALCQKIAQRHGGTIKAEGTEGEGAIFTVVLPLQQA